jgi:hypothetical protein
LGIANGGTGQTTQTAAFDALSPLTTKGDLIVHDGTNNVRLGVGATNRALFADSTTTEGVAWKPSPFCVTYTIDYTDSAFWAVSTTADIALFTVAQYQKITGITVKHSTVFGDGAGAMTDVTVSVGRPGGATFYTAATSIGETTPVADSAFQDTNLFSGGAMAAAGDTVQAHFIATGSNFGTGAATNLTGGAVKIWVCGTSLQ